MVKSDLPTVKTANGPGTPPSDAAPAECKNPFVPTDVNGRDGLPAGDETRPALGLWRGVALAVIIALGAIFVALHWRQVPEAGRALREANFVWLAAAAALCGLYLAGYVLLHLFAARSVGLRWGLRDIVLPATGGHFLNMVVVNSGGMGGLPLMLRTARRKGHSPGLATVAYLLVAQLSHLVFAMLLGVSLAVAWSDGEVTKTEWGASAVFAVYTAFALGALVAASRSKAALERLERTIQRVAAFVRRVLRRHPALAPAADDELYSALHTLTKDPLRAAPAAVVALALDLCGVGMLWAVLEALGVHTGVTTPLFGYCMGVVFSVVGFLPAGLGFAEAGIGVALVSSGVPGPEAALAVLGYRLLEVWVPFALGGLALAYQAGAD